MTAETTSPLPSEGVEACTLRGAGSTPAGGSTGDCVRYAIVVSEFQQLLTQWRTECRFLSSTTTRTSHAAFRRIVSMGSDVVPLLVDRLDEPGDWDIALTEIVGNDPVPASARGNRGETALAWRRWYARVFAVGRAEVARREAIDS